MFLKKKTKEEVKFNWINGFVLLDSKPTKYEIGNTYGEEYTFLVHENLRSIFYQANDFFSVEGKEVYEVKGYVKDKSNSQQFFLRPFSEVQHLSIKTTIQKKLKWRELKDAIIKYFPMIETKDEYEQAKKTGYTEFAKTKFTKKAIELGHSETFATFVFPDNRERDKVVYDKMIALNEEGLSKDMIAYLLLS